MYKRLIARLVRERVLGIKCSGVYFFAAHTITSSKELFSSTCHEGSMCGTNETSLLHKSECAMTIKNSLFSILLIFAWTDSLWANNTGVELDRPSSRAVISAIESCRVDGCKLDAYQIAITSSSEGIEVVFWDPPESAADLFHRDRPSAGERHYLFNPSSGRIIKKWYGK